MTDSIILTVELVDLESFELYPGANQFSSEFSEYSINRSSFSFSNDSELNRAVERLNELNLSFQQFFKRTLDSDSELQDYPAVFLVPVSDILIKSSKKEGIDIEEKKLKAKLLLADLKTDDLFFVEEIKNLIESLTASTSFEPLSSKEKYFRLASIHDLSSPQIILSGSGVSPSHNSEFEGYHVENSDDKILLDQPAIAEIKHFGIVRSKNFIFQDKPYPLNSATYILTGEIGIKLKHLFSKRKTNLNFIIPVV